jgi:hypothetical protein
LSVHQEQSGRRPPIVLHVVGDVAPSGEAIGLQIERSEQGPVDLCIRTQDVKYLVSLLLNLGCEARRRQAPGGSDVPPTEAIPCRWTPSMSARAMTISHFSCLKWESRR